jgi:hypothetical protein
MTELATIDLCPELDAQEITLSEIETREEALIEQDGEGIEICSTDF